MNRNPLTYIPVAVAITVAVCAAATLLLGSAPALGAALDSAAHSCALPQLAAPYVQRRVVEKAAQGIVPLRQYLWSTRMIHRLDVMQTVAWLDEARAAEQACLERVAAGTE